MRGHGEKWSRKKDQAIIALLSHSSIEQAARAVGVGVATLWRWLQRADFQEEYRKARRDAVGRAVGQLQQACAKAVQALEEIAAKQDAPASARVAAARVILETSIKAIELQDLQARIEALENTVKAKDDRVVPIRA